MFADAGLPGDIGAPSLSFRHGSGTLPHLMTYTAPRYFYYFGYIT